MLEILYAGIIVDIKTIIITTSDNSLIISTEKIIGLMVSNNSLTNKSLPIEQQAKQITNENIKEIILIKRLSIRV